MALTKRTQHKYRGHPKRVLRGGKGGTRYRLSWHDALAAPVCTDFLWLAISVLEYGRTPGLCLCPIQARLGRRLIKISPFFGREKHSWRRRPFGDSYTTDHPWMSLSPVLLSISEFGRMTRSPNVLGGCGSPRRLSRCHPAVYVKKSVKRVSALTNTIIMGRIMKTHSMSVLMIRLIRICSYRQSLLI